MNKVLIICDESDEFCINLNNSNELFSKKCLFISWNSIISKDRNFINKCYSYALAHEVITRASSLTLLKKIISQEQDFMSLEERSYLDVLYRSSYTNLESHNRADAYSFSSTNLTREAIMQFFCLFQEFVSQTEVTRVIITHKLDTDYNLIAYRNILLNSWSERDENLNKKDTLSKPIKIINYGRIDELINAIIKEICKQKKQLRKLKKQFFYEIK